MRKIVHTADWHLGCRLCEEDRIEEHRKFLGWLEELLATERPDLLIVAGDVFDLYTPSNGAQSLYYDFLAHVFRGELARHVVVTAGNHDSPSVLASPSRALSCLDVTVVPCEGAEQAFAFECADGGRLAVAAIPFLKESFLRNRGDESLPVGKRQADGFRRHVAEVSEKARSLAPGAPLVVTAHCTVSGVSPFADFREGGAIGGVDAVGSDDFPAADYVALGHIHVPQAVGGCETIRYAGSVLPMNFGEAGYDKSVSVVEFPDDGPAAVRTVAIPVFQRLRTLKGTCEEVSAALHGLVTGKPDESLWIEIMVSDGEGDIGALRAQTREELAGTAVRLLSLRDLRPRLYGANGEAPAKIDLKVTEPIDLARERLREENLSDPEIEDYLSLIRTALDDADRTAVEGEEVAR